MTDSQQDTRQQQRPRLRIASARIKLRYNYFCQEAYVFDIVGFSVRRVSQKVVDDFDKKKFFSEGGIYDEQ